MIRVGICGGIGSGKSTICRMFAERGVAVYSSDERAKSLMNTSEEVRAALREAFGEECYTEQGLNRAYLASVVFGDEQRLALLNSIVHPAVQRDFEQWAERQQGDYIILESAILFESHFDSLVDFTIAVLAPQSLRLERAMQRDGATREQIESRMAVQMSDDDLVKRVSCAIVNISIEDVQKDVAEIDGRLRRMAYKSSENEK